MGGRGCERDEPSARLQMCQVSECDPHRVACGCGQRDAWQGREGMRRKVTVRHGGPGCETGSMGDWGTVYVSVCVRV